MKKWLVAILCMAAGTSYAQTDNYYTLFYNYASPGRNFPVMVGMVNVAAGDQRGTEMALCNVNGANQQGAQFGLLNLTSGNVRGAQFGVANAFGGNQYGGLFGVINLVGGTVHGGQFGVLNVFGGDADGGQFGVMNLNGGSFRGAQFGMLNVNGGGTQGAQFGMLNITPEMRGTQFGLLNIVGHYKQGTPIGLLSIIGEGGYQAVEVGTSSMFPVTLAVKTGVERFYTSIIAGWSPDFHKQVAMGVGFGMLSPISEKWYFNTEVNYISTFEKESASICEFQPNFGYRLGGQVSLLAAPVLSWQMVDKGQTLNPAAYPLWDHRIDDRNALYLGVRLALRWEFQW